MVTVTHPRRPVSLHCSNVPDCLSVHDGHTGMAALTMLLTAIDAGVRT
jgi:hypothetical protein